MGQGLVVGRGCFGEQEVETLEDRGEGRCGEAPDACFQIRFVDGRNLGDIDNAGAREACHSLPERDIPWGERSVHV